MPDTTPPNDQHPRADRDRVKRYPADTREARPDGHAGPGRDAERPQDIGRRGWKQILGRTRKEVGNDDLGLVSAGVAFYALLAIFPALAAVVSIYGLVADPAQVQSPVEALRGTLPADVVQIVEQQLQSVASGAGGALTFGAIASILFAIWSANKGTKALITALNIAYEEDDDRGFFKKNAVSLALTVGGIVGVVIAIGLVAALPPILDNVGLGQAAETALRWGRWPLLAIGIAGFASVLYRWGPHRQSAKWRWLTPGAAVASLLWLGLSALFSWYVSSFGSYNETYGSLGAVVVMLMWLFLSAFVLLLGAELDSEMEHQTARDSTTGPPRPMGERGAYMADHVSDEVH